MAGAQHVEAREHGSLISFLQVRSDVRTPVATVAAPKVTTTQALKVDDTGLQADDFVIYHHMWQKNGTELGPLGRYQLEMIARRFQSTSFPLVIESSHDDKLDCTRRDMIISLLGSRGFHNPQRVIVASPEEESHTK
jgi:hypothetical protein